jgi:hypothetical protein
MSDRKLPWLVKRLEEATKSAIAQSEEVARVVEDANTCGYQFTVLIDVLIQDAGREPKVAGAATAPELQLNADDLHFLRSLRITFGSQPT